LQGQEDIESLEKSIKEYSSQLRKHDTRILVCPLYAALPMSHQTQVFALTPPDTRKCILATNIAETAITIPGIRHVIDSGKYKEKMYSTTFKSAMEALITKSISKASAMQRAGRAGREGPGTCFRLYTEEGFRSLRESSTPEIQRSNLASSILQLKYLNQDPETVDWMDSPGRDALEAALITLFAIQAIDRTRALTPLGRLMASFPVEPSLARAILASREQNCSNEVVDIVAVLSTTSTIFFDPSEAREDASEARRKFRHPTGDHIMFLNLFRAYEEVLGSLGRHGAIDWCRKHYINERALAEAVRIRDQIRSSCERLNINWKTSSRLEPEPILKSFLAGSPQNAAQLHPDFDYRQLIGSSVVKIHPSSTLIDKKVPVIMYNELIITSKIYARCVSSITRQFITELPLYSQTPSRTT
ncbi:P-loop containing nucleoside triphosphate hydrolase protein, partial [Sistotremastrum suecicum HHB10207 ss-3]